jgi:hypothetical protein
MKMRMKILIVVLLSLAASNVTVHSQSWQSSQFHPPKTTVWVIIGYSLDLNCDKSGCLGVNAYWTGLDKPFRDHWPNGWSPNWKDAKRYGKDDPDPYYDVPNGMHCCYSEYPTPINSKTGREDYKGIP